MTQFWLPIINLVLHCPVQPTYCLLIHFHLNPAVKLGLIIYYSWLDSVYPIKYIGKNEGEKIIDN